MGVTNVAGDCLLPGAQGLSAGRVTLRRVGHPEPGDPGTLAPGQAGPRHSGNEPFRNPDVVNGPGLRVARAALQLRLRSQSVPVVMALCPPARPGLVDRCPSVTLAPRLCGDGGILGTSRLPMCGSCLRGGLGGPTPPIPPHPPVLSFRPMQDPVRASCGGGKILITFFFLVFVLSV